MTFVLSSAPALRFEVYSQFLLNRAKGVINNDQDCNAGLVVGICSGVVIDLAQGWGGTSRHHNYKGGLLVHTAEVVRAWEMIQGKFLTREEYLAALMHDYAKLFEYCPTTGKELSYRQEIGHVTGSVIEFHRKFDIYLSRDSQREITRLMLSHHGKRVWKSPTVPTDGSALGLHAADMMSVEHGRIRIDELPEMALFREGNFVSVCPSDPPSSKKTSPVGLAEE